jgi:hypothetical protein
MHYSGTQQQQKQDKGGRSSDQQNRGRRNQRRDTEESSSRVGKWRGGDGRSQCKKILFYLLFILLFEL